MRTAKDTKKLTMKNIKKCKTTDLEVKLLLMSLPTGIIPKRAVMRLDVSHYLTTHTAEEEERLRWSVVRAAKRNKLLVKKTLAATAQRRDHPSVVYMITYAGIDFLVSTVGDQHPWLKTMAEKFKNRNASLYRTPNKDTVQFYRALSIKDFELMVRDLHKELAEGYITGSANVAIREAVNVALAAYYDEAAESEADVNGSEAEEEDDDDDFDDDFDEDEEDIEDYVEEDGDIENPKKLSPLQSSCYLSYLAHHPGESLIETVLPDLPCDGLFINSRILNADRFGTEKGELKKHFHSNAIGVYLNQNHSFLVFHTTRYGTSWDKTAISNDVRRYEIISTLLGYRSALLSGLILADSPAHFAELFENKWRRKRYYYKRKPAFAIPFRNVYVLPASKEGIEQLDWLEYYGDGMDREMVDVICHERHYGYVTVSGDETYQLMYDGQPMFNGVTFNATLICTIYNKYKEAKKKGKDCSFVIYCESWQKKWYEKLFPDVAIYTERDIPLQKDPERS